ncbi:MAG: hypothetical protein JW829_20240, partial [Pirellulales bacterium]|nr:hypothetical protein [Pirellulales bacterium]
MNQEFFKRHVSGQIPPRWLIEGCFSGQPDGFLFMILSASVLHRQEQKKCLARIFHEFRRERPQVVLWQGIQTIRPETY